MGTRVTGAAGYTLDVPQQTTIPTTLVTQYDTHGLQGASGDTLVRRRHGH